MTPECRSPSTPVRRHLSLPPCSPFNPFDSPSSPISRFQGELDTESSPASSRTASPAREVQVAYVAPRSTADILGVMDLSLTRREMGRPRPSAEAAAAAKSDALNLRQGQRQLPTSVVAMTTTASKRGSGVDVELLRPLSAFNPSPAKFSPALSSPDSTHHPSSPISPPTGDADAEPVDKSFMRWSKTASTIFSEAPSSHFYFNKRSTGLSDFAPSPEKQRSSTGYGKEASDESLTGPSGMRRESAGTFGSRQRRWSAIGSSPSGRPGDGDDPFNDPYKGESFWDDDELIRSASTGSRPRRRRPVTMSSASDSTHMMSTAEHSRVDANHAHTAPGGCFTYLSQRKASQKTHENEDEITTHPLKPFAKNNLRIVPRNRPTPTLGAALTNSPPSPGTPLRGGAVKEESVLGETSEVGLGQQLPISSRKRLGKLDQMLGEGAETARVLIEFEKRAIESSVQTGSIHTSQPIPPPRGHKPSASVPSVMLLSTPMTSLRSYDPSEFLASPSPGLGRSASVDSLPSLHPSLSESITTLSRLLPASTPPPPLPPLPPKSLPLPPLQARNDLQPEQRTMLLRRTRKLEQMLGEPLPESQVERLVVEPSNASTTVVTQINNEWPTTPSPRRKVPEWAREDCAPRIVRDPLATGGITLARSGSKFARKAKAALGLEKKDDEPDLRVYVAREMRVSETSVRGEAVAVSQRPSVNRQAWSSPTSPTTPVSPADPVKFEDVVERRSEESEDGGRRARRQQLAKLHRLLGVQIPPSLLNPHPSTDDLPLPAATIFTPNGLKASDSPSDLSFMTFDEPDSASPPPSWASRFKTTVASNLGKDRRGKSSPSPTGFTDKEGKEASFVDLRHSDEMTPVALSEKEKAMARRRAAKLEQKFGDVPPPSMYLPSRPSVSLSPGSSEVQLQVTPFPASPTHLPTPVSHFTRDENSNPPEPAYESYNRSLQNLLFLVDNDRARLVTIVDSLETPDFTPTRPAPRPPGSSQDQRHEIRISKSLGDGLMVDRNSPSPPSPALRSPTMPASPYAYKRDTEAFDEGDEDNEEDKHEGLGVLDGNDGFDPNSRSARRRRTGKLSSFFGETNINFSSPNPPPHLICPGAGNWEKDRSERESGKTKSKTKTKTRRETLDSVLGEMWRGVQSDMKRGGLGVEEGNRLGELMWTLRRRSGGVWEEI